jgi:DNA polymerase
MIRSAIIAPPGWRIVHRDSSQIEARMCAWLAKCDGLLAAFAQGRDVYSEFASIFYGRTITRADKPERFVGKTSILGLGYGMGAERFRHTLFIGQGGVSVKVSIEEAQKLVNLHVALPEIPQLWATSDQFARSLMKTAGVSRPQIRQCIRAEPEVVWLPNNMPLNYRNLRKDYAADRSYDLVYDDAYGGKKKLFGGKVVENLCQALARIVITEIMTRVRASDGPDHPRQHRLPPRGKTPRPWTSARHRVAKAPTWARAAAGQRGGWGKPQSEQMSSMPIRKLIRDRGGGGR